LLLCKVQRICLIHGVVQGSMHVISAVVDGRLLRSRYYLLPLIDWVPIDACMVWIPILKYRVGEFCLMSSLFIH
jgi:hypothetical protein